ncbi:hypothetical protein EBR57_06130, partial [bacterium]|nr:hypothetical protein [bacterium]
MQRLSDTTVTAVKTNHDIVGIIQDYVKLKKRGRNYIGLCPFHSERTPSFTVSPEKHLWHCFGCQESGDAIGFVMKADHLSFTEAIEHIALKVGIPIEWEEQSPEAAGRPPDRHHAHARAALRRVVPAGGARGGSRREQPRARLHGDQAVGLPAVGEHAARARSHVQGHGPQERLLPAVHPAQLPREGGGARGGLREGVRGGHAPSSAGGHEAGRTSGPGAGRRARGAARGAADQRDHHRRQLREVGAELPRPAAAHQPVGERGALGDAHAPLPAHGRVPVAGGSHRARHRGRGARGDDEDARRVRRLRRELDGDAGDQGPQDRWRALPRRGGHLLDRGHDAGPQGAAG